MGQQSWDGGRALVAATAAAFVGLAFGLSQYVGVLELPFVGNATAQRMTDALGPTASVGIGFGLACIATIVVWIVGGARPGALPVAGAAALVLIASGALLTADGVAALQAESVKPQPPAAEIVSYNSVEIPKPMARSCKPTEAIGRGATAAESCAPDSSLGNWGTYTRFADNILLERQWGLSLEFWRKGGFGAYAVDPGKWRLNGRHSIGHCAVFLARDGSAYFAWTDSRTNTLNWIMRTDGDIDRLRNEWRAVVGDDVVIVGPASGSE